MLSFWLLACSNSQTGDSSRWVAPAGRGRWRRLHLFDRRDAARDLRRRDLPHRRLVARQNTTTRYTPRGRRSATCLHRHLWQIHRQHPQTPPDHDTAWGQAQAKDFVEHRYHQPSDEYKPDIDFRGDALMAEFGYTLGQKAASGSSVPAARRRIRANPEETPIPGRKRGEAGGKFTSTGTRLRGPQGRMERNGPGRSGRRSLISVYRGQTPAVNDLMVLNPSRSYRCTAV